MAALRAWRWRLALPVVGIGLPFFTIHLMNLLDDAEGPWTVVVGPVLLAFWGIVALPGMLYALRGWRTVAVMCAWWAVVGLVVGWAWDREGVRFWWRRRERATL